jgi:hypothetical protein
MRSLLPAPVCPPQPSASDLHAIEFLEAHLDVWDLFVRFTFELIHKGHAHGGAKAVVERIRWHSFTSAHVADLEFVCNNNSTASLARIFAATYPAHADFFRTRKRPTESRAA